MVEIKSKTLDEIVNSIGIGIFTGKLLFVVGFVWLIDSAEITLISLISPFLKCYWNLTPLEVTLTSCALFLGMGIGSMFWGKFADMYGRRNILLLAVCYLSYFAFLSCFVGSYIWFLLIRCFVGIGASACAVIPPCYIAEYVPSNYRAKLIVLLELFFAFGNIYVAVLAMLTLPYFKWKMFLLLTAVPCFISILLVYTLPESLRYLQLKGDINSIRKILSNIWKCKNPDLQNCTIVCSPVSENVGSISLLFSKKYRFQSIMLAILWICTFVSYFSMVFINTTLLQMKRSKEAQQCKYLTIDDYIQNIIVVVGEIPGVLLCYLFVERIGRRNCIIISSLIIGILFLILNVELSPVLLTILMVLARSAGPVQTQMVYAITAELYPTHIRVTAVSMLNTITRWSLMLSPFLVQYLMVYSLPAMTFIFFGLNVLSCISCCTLKETTGISLDS